jgi:tetratricopeptide (TPR) repeat protein
MHARISQSGPIKAFALSGFLGYVLILVQPSHAQDAKFAADNLKYSRDFYSKVHFVAIANLDFGAGGTAEFKYDRYPNGGPERIQAGDGEFARKNGKTWLRSNDWGETGKPVDAQTAKRLNNWVGLIDARLNGEPVSNDPGEGATVMKFLGNETNNDLEEFVFEESKEKPKAKSYPRISFGRFKNAKDQQVLLSHFSGPMRLGAREATVKISFSHLIAVKMQETVHESPSPASSPAAEESDANLVNRGIEKAKNGDLDGALTDFDHAIELNPKDDAAYYNRAQGKWLKKDAGGAIADYTRAYYNRAVTKQAKGDATGADADFKTAKKLDPELASEKLAADSKNNRPSGVTTVNLLDGKLKLDIPPDFSREPDDPTHPKTIAKFSGPADGAWGEVLRGTHGLTPEKLEGYLKMRVDEYNKGFKWLPKDSRLQWLKKEIVTIDGRKWADWRYVPILNGKKDYSHNPVYTRFLTTSYKGQLLEITFTSNLNTEPKLKEEIDHIMDSVHLEE